MATLDEGDIDSQNPSNGGALKDSSLSADPSKAFSLSEDVGVEKTDAIRTSPWKRGSDCDFSVPAIDIVDGVASMLIPEEVFDEAELLWKRYEVGYFIGDAPHMGSIHATINRIWASPKGGSKIDVQFIEKNTVLFRIENGHTRARVIQRLYWHISDVPLVVSEWSPESALKPPDLSAMPLWIDLKGVPNGLFSHKGLKCLTRAAGKFTSFTPIPKNVLDWILLVSWRR